MSDVLDSLVGGFWLNLQIFVMTLLMALPLGLVITFGSMTKFRPLRYLTRVFVWIIRGTPLMLQLFVVMYMPGLVFGIPMKSRMSGMTRSQVFFRVVLLQVVKRITPPMSNEVITLVKDTALARVVSVAEIIMCAERYTKQGLIWPLFSTGFFFLLFNGVLTLLFGYFEKKMDYFKG